MQEEKRRYGLPSLSTMELASTVKTVPRLNRIMQDELVTAQCVVHN